MSGPNPLTAGRYRHYFKHEDGYEAWSGYSFDDPAAAELEAGAMRARLSRRITVAVVMGFSKEPARPPEPPEAYRLYFKSPNGEAWSGYTHDDYAAAATDAAETQARLGEPFTVTVVRGDSREPARPPAEPEAVSDAQ